MSCSIPARTKPNHENNRKLKTSLPILYEDNHLLVVNKPAGLVTQGAKAGESSVHSLASEYLKKKYQKPGNVYLGIVSRLDKNVSGVLVLARTSKAAARLNEQFRVRAASKRYFALAENGFVDNGLEKSGTLQHQIYKDDASQRMRVADSEKPVRHGSKSSKRQLATLDYQVLAADASKCLLRIDLRTGRKHQIRVQLAEIGCPIIGDLKYGGRRWAKRSAAMGAIGLHSYQLLLEHPTQRRAILFSANIPEIWHLPKDWQPVIQQQLDAT